MEKSKNEAVVLVHGLWMTGVDLVLLRHRLRQCGFNTAQFSYHTVRRDIKQNVSRLQQFVSKQQGGVMTFIGHSRGGLLLRQLFHDYPEQRPGRIVTLGTPHMGSVVARKFNRSSMGRFILGRSLEKGLLGDVPPWQSTHELGVIAGTLSIGVGQIMPGLEKPNDGTVAVKETNMPGMTDHIEMPVSHTALLFSAEVAKQTCYFLNAGCFQRS